MSSPANELPRHPKVYEYAVANAAHRVRIALELKGLPYERIPVDLRVEERERNANGYDRLNPQHLVPTLVDGRLILTQSIAIMEYLEEACPDPPLLPSGTDARARVRALALMIACDCQPLVNLRVREYLVDELGLAEETKDRWMAHWMALTFEAYEQCLRRSADTGRFSHGDSPTMADACLVPQVTMATRFGIATEGYTEVLRVFESCLAVSAFQRATPE